jgi:hypothetical protein
MHDLSVKRRMVSRNGSASERIFPRGQGRQSFFIALIKSTVARNSAAMLCSCCFSAHLMSDVSLNSAASLTVFGWRRRGMIEGLPLACAAVKNDHAAHRVNALGSQ